MNPRLKAVRPLPESCLELQFENGEMRVFDASPYLESGFFRELVDEAYFRRVTVKMGTVEWPHGQDFCPDTLYLDSQPQPSGQVTLSS